MSEQKVNLDEVKSFKKDELKKTKTVNVAQARTQMLAGIKKGSSGLKHTETVNVAQSRTQVLAGIKKGKDGLKHTETVNVSQVRSQVLRDIQKKPELKHVDKK